MEPPDFESYAIELAEGLGRTVPAPNPVTVN